MNVLCPYPCPLFRSLSVVIPLFWSYWFHFPWSVHQICSTGFVLLNCLSLPFLPLVSKIFFLFPFTIRIVIKGRMVRKQHLQRKTWASLQLMPSKPNSITNQESSFSFKFYRVNRFQKLSIHCHWIGEKKKYIHYACNTYGYYLIQQAMRYKNWHLTYGHCLKTLAQPFSLG